jgi:hypothetical protein
MFGTPFLPHRLAGLIAVGLLACGGRTSGPKSSDAGSPATVADDAPSTPTEPADDAGDLSDAPTAFPPPSDAPQCTGNQLAAAKPITITTPDPAPSSPTLASSPSGDRFLAVWTDGGRSINNVAIPETVWATMIVAGSAGVPASAAMEVAASGACPVAAWGGTGFAIAWGDSEGLRLQLVDTAGAPVGASSLVLSRPNVQACPISLVATSAGLALAWYEGESVLEENVGLVGATGPIGTKLELDAVGPGVSPNVGLGVLGGQTYAAFAEWPGGDSPSGRALTFVARIDWSQGAAVSQGTAPGFLISLVVADGQLLFTTQAFGGGGAPLAYGGTPGAGFPRAVGMCGTEFCEATLAADGCGRIVQVGNEGFTPGGFAEGFFVQPLQSSAPPVELGDVSESSVVGAQSTFGVLWYWGVGPGGVYPGEEPQTGTLSFTTLSWQ